MAVPIHAPARGSPASSRRSSDLLSGKVLGVCWSGPGRDFIPGGDMAGGYKPLFWQHPAGKFDVQRDVEKYLFSQAKTPAKGDECGHVRCSRGLVNSVRG